MIGKAFQRVVRDRVATPKPEGVRLSLKRARIRPISKRLATEVIVRYEWLGTMSATQYHFGIFFPGEDGREHIAGVTCVGGSHCTAGPYTHCMFEIERSDLLILARGACVSWAPPNTNSKLVSWTTRLLRKEGLGKLVIAYADEQAGEIGTIYQACGWTYVGRGRPTVHEIVSPEGVVSNTQIFANRMETEGVSWQEAKQRYLDEGWEFREPNPKHRYVCQVADDEKLERVLEDLSEPYPSRDPETAHLVTSAKQRYVNGKLAQAAADESQLGLFGVGPVLEEPEPEEEEVPVEDHSEELDLFGNGDG